MLKQILAAAAAAALAAPAGAATVVYEGTGTAVFGVIPIPVNPRLDPGSYRLQFDLSEPRYAAGNAGLRYTYDYLCGPNLVVCGGNDIDFYLIYQSTDRLHWTTDFAFPAPTMSTILTGDPPHYTRTYWRFFGPILLDHTGPDVTYDVKLVQLYAIVPESASWAMMITGFGLLGAAARRRTANGKLARVSAY